MAAVEYGMTAESTLRAGRRAAEVQMLDTCTISRPTGRVTNPDGTVSTTYPQVYAGRCKVQTYEAYESTPEAGERAWTVQRYSIHVPVGDPVRVDDVVTINTSVLDADLVGREYRVVALLHKSFATAQRLGVEEVVS
jgi:hypothetical protein